MMEKITIRKDLNDMVKGIEFKKIKTRYNERNVAVVTFFNNEQLEFKDTEGLYDLFSTYRKVGQKDFIKSKMLVEELITASADITGDIIDESTGTYICVLYELQDGQKCRLFPARRYVDRKIIDLLYGLYKEQKKQSKKEN